VALLAIALGPLLQARRQLQDRLARLSRSVPDTEDTLAVIAAELRRLRELAERQAGGPG
jgi:hypothetical protein